MASSTGRTCGRVASTARSCSWHGSGIASGQAELGTGEDSHRVAQPVASMGGQQPADSPRLGGPYLDRGRNAGAVAGSEREQLADAELQAAQPGRIQRHLHIQRQQPG